MLSLEKLTLKDFQLADIERMQDNPSNLVCWEMGTGKTRFGVGIDLIRRTEGKFERTLVVCPTVAVLNVWAKTFGQFTDLRIATIEPAHRKDSWDAAISKQAEVIIIHWAAVRLIPQLSQMQWFHVIADEVHRISERKTLTAKSLKAVKANYKTGMSGTPTDGRPDKLFSILQWLYPKEYKSYWKFYELYCDSTIVYPGGYRVFNKPKNLPHLHERIKEYYSVHFKRKQCCIEHPNGVIPYMPNAPIQDTIFVTMGSKQSKQYEEMRRDLLTWLSIQSEDLNSVPLIAQNAISKLVRLQQFAAAEMIALPNGDVRLSMPSPKIDALIDLKIDNPDERIVVFSQFAQLIELGVTACEKHNFTTCKIVGGQSQSERQAQIEKFLATEGSILLCTIRSGGEAIDGLQYGSSICIFLDRDWNPGNNQQAIARLDRMGQQTQVQVIDIQSENTVDMGRFTQIEMKSSWLMEFLKGATV